MCVRRCPRDAAKGLRRACHSVSEIAIREPLSSPSPPMVLVNDMTDLSKPVHKIYVYRSQDGVAPDDSLRTSATPIIEGARMKRLLHGLPVLLLSVAVTVAAPIGMPPAVAANTLPANPLGFAYAATTNVTQYAHPAGMLITGRCNRYAADFATARANGAEVLAYLNPVQRPDSSVCALDDAFYGGPPGSTDLWPYPTPGTRSNWPGTHMVDIQAGSAWADQAVAYIANLMTEDKVDGVFLDDIGARPWTSLAAWDSWPATEQERWTLGAVDLVRRLDAKRRAINPRFIIVNNNVWDVPNTRGTEGEPYVDGICLEHQPPDSAYHVRVAGKAYGNLGHRRVLAIAHDPAEAQQWAAVQGVTHVSDQTDYGAVTTPPVPFHRLTDRPKTFGRTTVAGLTSAPMTTNQKRGSKFTLSDKATLLQMKAYLDGTGATTGSASVRLVLYRDSGGVPGARLAQSPTATINAGLTGRWVSFNPPPVALNPGAYWIVIHTGGTDQLIRNRGDGAANWYANLDDYSDGATDPFGTGWTGSVTLSVNATYTMGY